MLRFKRLKAMSLIELLIAISISILMMGVSIPIFVHQAKTSNLETSARTVEEFVLRGKNYAQNPDREFPSLYTVVLKNGANNQLNAKIKVSFRPVGSNADDPISTEEIDQINIANTAIVSPDEVSVSFKPTTGEASEAYSFQVKSSNSSETKTISVNTSGMVEIK